MKKIVLTSLVASMIPFSANVQSYEVVEVNKGGAITGKVTFSGDDPAPVKFLVTKDVEVCGQTREIDFVKVNNGALNDVVVYLENVEAGKPFPQKDKQAKIEQKKCEYGPLLNVMIQGENLEIINMDKVAHKMHASEMMDMGSKKTMFNISQPVQGTVTKEVKIKEGVGMKMECEQHEFMQGFMFVAKNPYYALVTEEGTFTIEDIPSGNYTVKTWHGKLKKHPQANVSVESGKEIVVNFDYSK